MRKRSPLSAFPSRLRNPVPESVAHRWPAPAAAIARTGAAPCGADGYRLRAWHAAPASARQRFSLTCVARAIATSASIPTRITTSISFPTAAISCPSSTPHTMRALNSTALLSRVASLCCTRSRSWPSSNGRASCIPPLTCAYTRVAICLTTCVWSNSRRRGLMRSASA